MRSWGLSILLLVPAGVLAQHGSSTVVNPYTGRQDVEAGAKLYRSQCASCHGFDGNGTAAGPTLIAGTFRHGGSDEALFHTINKGVPGTSMPAFNYTGRQIWQLVTLIRSLAITHGGAHISGDAKAGAAVFRANCTGCHAISGTGGFVGPDMNSIGSKLSAVELKKAILEPDASVPASYWSVKAVTKSGRTVEGMRLNEDTFSIQVRDRNGRLQSLLKSELTSTDLVRHSPMPSLAGKLSEAELNDLVAYLSSLKGEQ
jgi:putative heme-binding domain-containing protein